MLRDLHIRNLAVLAEGSIELGPGLNVLSGETGAGKSIIVDSLALLSGIRARAELIRTGAETLSMTGVFDPADGSWRRSLEAIGVDPGEGDLMVRREISRGGRNRVFVNDQPVTLGLLADLMPPLLRIHGQREELGLVAPDMQRAWLDRCGGAAGEVLLAKVRAAFTEYRGLAQRLEKLSGDDRMRRERIDFLRFQLDEIDRAEVSDGEETSLRQKREVLRHGEAIESALSLACEHLFDREGSAYEALEMGRQQLHGIAAWEPEAVEWASELEELRIRTGELQASLQRRRDAVESDPGQLNAVEERLATLERLLRKYGDTTSEVLAKRERLAAELEELEGDENTDSLLRQQVEDALSAYRQVADELSTARQGWGRKLVKKVRAELGELALGKARFEVALGVRKRSGSPLKVGGEGVELGEHGFDQVTFRFSPNPGEEARPLARVASGGELSRVYLAVQLASQGFKSAAGAPAVLPTLVFDEVDTGIGGAEAAALGGKLRRLAQGGQILVVTHLPQVASCGDAHLKVSKEVVGKRTHTQVTKLTAEEREAEVARMLGGSEVTELSLSHARELIAESRG